MQPKESGYLFGVQEVRGSNHRGPTKPYMSDAASVGLRPSVNFPLQNLAADFADALAAVDARGEIHKSFQPGIGPFGEADAMHLYAKSGVRMPSDL